MGFFFVVVGYMSLFVLSGCGNEDYREIGLGDYSPLELGDKQFEVVIEAEENRQQDARLFLTNFTKTSIELWFEVNQEIDEDEHGVYVTITDFAPTETTGPVVHTSLKSYEKLPFRLRGTGPADKCTYYLRTQEKKDRH